MNYFYMVRLPGDNDDAEDADREWFAIHPTRSGAMSEARSFVNSMCAQHITKVVYLSHKNPTSYLDVPTDSLTVEQKTGHYHGA